jgi:pyruvate dehydrogenase E1 component
MPQDLDPVETSEWREAFDSVIEFDGADRAGFLLEELIGEARRNGAPVPYAANTPYLNTIAPGSSRCTRATGSSSTGSGR